MCVNYFSPLPYTLGRQLWEDPLWGLPIQANLRLPEYLFEQLNPSNALLQLLAIW